MTRTIPLMLVATALVWDHNGCFTPGFVVEQSTNLTTWTVIGFVSVTNIWQTNRSDMPYTYRFELTNQPPGRCFYRVGATYE